MASVLLKECPICKLSKQKVHTVDYGERLSLECRRCGKFTITASAAKIAESQQFGPKLSAWIREHSESGREVPEINSYVLKDLQADLPSYRVSEKLLLLLRALERRTDFPGQSVGITPLYDYPLPWAACSDELNYLLNDLTTRDLIKRKGTPANLNDSSEYKYAITALGWDFLDEHERPAVMSDQVFVAMSFSDELKPAWENAIKPALKKAQYRPYRVDAEPHIDRIDVKIITEIKNSRFLVADVTHQRPGVYFEAGYALGLGLPVIWSVRRDELNDVHFDTRQYNHIVWGSEEELSEQLHLYVTAIIGKRTAT